MLAVVLVFGFENRGETERMHRKRNAHVPDKQGNGALKTDVFGNIGVFSFLFLNGFEQSR